MAARTEEGRLLVTLVAWEGASLRAELVDAAMDTWTFVADPSALSPEPVPAGAPLPRPGAIRCRVVRDELVDGILVVHVDTAEPDGVRSVDGVSRFRVLRASVV